MTGPERAEQGSAAPVPVENLSYTQASRELDAIVEFFEQREVDVDQLVSRLERATAIVDELDRRIRRTRSQVEELVPRLEAAARAAADADERAGPGVEPVPPGAGRPSGADDTEEEEEDDELFEDESFAEEDVEEESEVWDDEGDEEDDLPEHGRDGADRPLF